MFLTQTTAIATHTRRMRMGRMMPKTSSGSRVTPPSSEVSEEGAGLVVVGGGNKVRVMLALHPWPS